MAMKQVCLLCERTAADNNLFCQETYCPAEMSPTILNYGDWLGDIEIIRPVIILRSAVLYEASHQKTKVLLKVAHPGQENTDRLKREADFLKEIQLKKKQSDYLPVLLPPYASASIKDDAYGKAMLQGHLLYFCLFQHFDGDALRDILTRNPQLWINHIGWIMIGVTGAVAVLQSEGVLHFGINPDAILVRFDEQSNVPSILLIDLGVACTAQNVKDGWYSFFVPPAYTAPELIDALVLRPSYATDVYGLGVTLYELLVGEPAFTFKLRSDQEVYAAVQQNRRVRMNRTEDVAAVANIAIQAVSTDIAARQQSAVEMAAQLHAVFGNIPRTTGRWPVWKTILIIVVVLTVVIGIILIGAYMM